MEPNRKMYLEDKKISTKNNNLGEINDEMKNNNWTMKKSGNILNNKLINYRKNLNVLIIFLYIILTYLFEDILSKNENRLIKSYSNIITLKLKLDESQYYYYVYSPYFSPKPNEVYINDMIQFSNDFTFFFNSTKDSSPKNVKLVWNNKITNCGSMFLDCYYITSIDLSDFDMSGVKNMSYMFSYCTELRSLTLSNLQTSSVEDMSYIFYASFYFTSLYISIYN